MAGLLEKDQIGKREQLADLILIADEKECPLTAMIPKGRKPTNTLARWQVDAYETPDTTGVVDGQDVTDYENPGRNRAELSVYCQRKWRPVMVSKMAEDVSVVAGASAGEMARAVRKKIEELRRDIEATIGSDNDTAVDDATTPYKTRGLGEWIKATAQSTLPVPTAFLTPAASINTTAMASLTEALFKGVLQSVYEQRGKAQNLTLVVGTALKTAITAFTNYKGGDTNTWAVIRAFTQEADSKHITSNVTLYDGDFNQVAILPSLLLASGTPSAPTRRGYVLDMDLLEMAFNQTPQVSPLPDMGGGPRKLIDTIFALKVLNPLGLGKFAATS